MPVLMVLKSNFMKMLWNIGKSVFRQMSVLEPNYVSSDCPLGGHHIIQGIKEHYEKDQTYQHPISLVRKAYGI